MDLQDGEKNISICCAQNKVSLLIAAAICGSHWEMSCSSRLHGKINAKMTRLQRTSQSLLCSDTIRQPSKILQAEHNIESFIQQVYLLGLTITPRILLLDHACFYGPACSHGASGGPCNDEQPKAHFHFPLNTHLGFYEIIAR